MKIQNNVEIQSHVAIVWHYLRDPSFSRFDTIPECDRHTHTDRRTDRHTTTTYTALSIASRGDDTREIAIKSETQSLSGRKIFESVQSSYSSQSGALQVWLLCSETSSPGLVRRTADGRRGFANRVYPLQNTVAPPPACPP